MPISIHWKKKMNHLENLRRYLQEKIKTEDQNRGQIQERFQNAFRNAHFNIPDGAKALRQIWAYAFEDLKLDKPRYDEWEKNLLND